MSGSKFTTHSHLCVVCGRHKGRGTDHARCSRIKQQQNEGSKPRNGKVTDSYINHFTRIK